MTYNVFGGTLSLTQSISQYMLLVQLFVLQQLTLNDEFHSMWDVTRCNRSVCVATESLLNLLCFGCSLHGELMLLLQNKCS